MCEIFFIESCCKERTARTVLLLFLNYLYETKNQNTMKKIWNKIKSYKYKIITTLLLLLVISIVQSLIPSLALGLAGAIIFDIICAFVLFSYFTGVYNIWKKDGNVLIAIIFGVVGLAFLSLMFYVIFFV